MADEALYRVAQEALHNTIKHARASNVQIALECAADTITLQKRTTERASIPQGSFSDTWA